MANEIVKKVVIPRKSISSVSEDGNYFLRYRIVSEDKTRTSHWSPFYQIGNENFQNTSNVISLIQEANGISIAWGIKNTLKTNNYDVYVRYDYSAEISAWNGGTNTTATELTGFVANLSTGTNLVTLTTGTTANMKVGQSVTKTGGAGAFNAALNLYIISITGTTTFTVGDIDGLPLNHATSGSTTFKVSGQSLNYETSTSGQTLFLPLPTIPALPNTVKVSVAVLAQTYSKYLKISSFKPDKPAVFLVESPQLTLV